MSRDAAKPSPVRACAAIILGGREAGSIAEGPFIGGLFDEAAEAGPAYASPTLHEAWSAIEGLSPRLAELIDKAMRAEAGLDDEAAALCRDYLGRGRPALEDWSAPATRAVLMAERRVTRELHRFYGILRFDLLDGVWAGRCEPDFDIGDLLLPRFAARFGKEDFLIVDERRLLRFGYLGGVLVMDEGGLPLPAGDEDLANASSRALWKSYFGAVEIQARKNPSCQDRHLPRRYRRLLPEFGSGDSAG